MLKKLILLLSLSVFAFGGYTLKLEKISDTVWKFCGEASIPNKANAGNMVNTYWIKGDTSWVVIDSGPSYFYAKFSYDKMKKIADLPVKYVVNTHWHDDHRLGNNFFRTNFKDAKLIGTEAQDKQYPPSKKPKMIELILPEDGKGTKNVKLDQYIKKDKTLKLDGVELEFKYLGYNAHTPEDIIVYLPREKVIFTGDLLFSERITSTRDGTVEGGLKSLDDIEKFDIKIFANGHGKHLDDTALKLMRSYFTQLKTTALEAIDEGLDMNEYVANTDFDNLKNLNMYDILHKQNLGFAYAEYEFYEGE